MLIHHFLEDAARRFPDKPAIWYRERWMSYSEIEEKASRLARYLRERGICRGQRVCLLLSNSHDYIISYYAILKADAVVVALNTDCTATSLEYLINNSEARAILAAKKYFKCLLPALKKTPDITTVVADAYFPEQSHKEPSFETTTFESVFRQMPRLSTIPRTISIDLSSIVYTSGSTGKAKGVMLSHLNIIDNTRSIIRYLQLTRHDRVMAVLPFYYVYGSTLLNTHIAAGGSVVIDNRFAFPNTVLHTMKEQSVTGFAGVPSTYMLLLSNSSLSEFAPFPNLRYVTQAGGHMAVSIQEQVAKAFAPANLIVMYGATEAAPRLTWLPPERRPHKKGSIGIPVPNTEVFIADDDGNRLPPGEIGEIVGRGSNIMMGYWKDSESTERVLKHGMYYTGDLGRMDEEGYLYVVGRAGDMLKIGGKRTSAKEIEEAILEIPQVREVAVIGIEDPVLGEAPKACIVPRKDGILDGIDLRHLLAKRLPLYKIPKIVELRTSLPKNQAGKILRSRLREQS
ncbi:MAG: AMP-binding protein [Chitinivibrionales bacterium]|nr:AMP-binding protein [Chitinivibrionales bacterium]MBD3358609.1 AMP-binding protein [Chitinivibrionales bacterium]